jgi:hypothetical protein
MAGDFRRIGRAVGQFRSPETLARIAKARPFAGLSATTRAGLHDLGTAWLGRADSNLDMANWKSDALACLRGAAQPFFVEIRKPFGTFEFREP